MTEKCDWADEIAATILADHNCEELVPTPIHRAIADALRAERAATVKRCAEIVQAEAYSPRWVSSGCADAALIKIRAEFPDAQRQRRDGPRMRRWTQTRHFPQSIAL